MHKEHKFWRGGVKHFVKRFLQLFYKTRLGYCGVDNDIHFPCHLGNPSHIFLQDFTLVQPGCRFIIHTGNVYIGKWSSLSCNCIVVTGNHVPTVGINQRLLARTHINDRESDIHIDEDCWVGVRVTILSGTHLRRGSVVGANSLLNKEYPPYAVLVGSPARIIASKFTIDQIMKHESLLYPEEERFTRTELEDIFNKYYSDKKTIGIDQVKSEDIGCLLENASMQYKIDYKNYENC